MCYDLPRSRCVEKLLLHQLRLCLFFFYNILLIDSDFPAFLFSFLVKSHFREGIDNLVKNSAVNLNIEMPPDDLVDDSTKEIIRLKFKVSRI